MAIKNYNKMSPYAETSQTSAFLDLWKPREISAYPSDVEFTISSGYNQRPDLMAYDFYGDSRLWWVFAVRNPDLIKDPIYDHKTGIQIMITQRELLLDLINV